MAAGTEQTDALQEAFGWLITNSVVLASCCTVFTNNKAKCKDVEVGIVVDRVVYAFQTAGLQASVDAGEQLRSDIVSFLCDPTWSGALNKFVASLAFTIVLLDTYMFAHVSSLLLFLLECRIVMHVTAP